MANDPVPPIKPAPSQPVLTPVAPPVASPIASAPTKKAASFFGYLFLGKGKPGEFIVFHHTNLFYWWPVWLLSLIFALLTFFGEKYMAIVPPRSATATAASGEATLSVGKKIDLAGRDIIVLDVNQKHVTHKDTDGSDQPIEPTVYVSSHRGLGSVFVIVLLVVITITNVHLRGLWSFFVLLVLVMGSIILAVGGWWDAILSRLEQLSIHINMGAYLLIGLVLFVLWAVNFFIFDRQTYLVFSAGQIRLRLEIGGGEMVHDTIGIVVHKQRSDLFRHWILGFGSGDLIIRPTGAPPIELPNVLRIGYVVKQIERLVKEKVVIHE